MKISRLTVKMRMELFVARDLLRRFEHEPDKHDLVGLTSTLAADLFVSGRSIRIDGCDESRALARFEETNRLTLALLELGEDEVSGSVAEQILTHALHIDSALLANFSAGRA